MAPPKNAAHYQRQFRARMREQGLVKKEVWILPENAGRLRDVERDLRLTQSTVSSGSNPMTTSENKPHEIWSMQSLYQALSNAPLFASGNATLQLVDGTDPCLEITMTEFGDLPIYVTVSGEQIIADAILWPLTQVKDAHALNDEILRTHKLFPLSTISLDRFPGGEDYYTIFGALSSASLLQNVVLEIETLAANAIKATEAYSQHLA
ncbi:YjfI family protein [Endozoicomonas arenosclerae]|uniref:YjfI family protein n=1 Tax=Endozoicomonas arenosclerae TaxID=1633495 RepID=UPI00078527A7|nr:YjfI family protein [Endozoicomonas arenosclerae]